MHPRADIGAGSELADGVVVSSGCVVTTDVVLGAGTLLNPRSGIGHDTVLGRCCVLNPGANVSGSVTLGDGVLVGSGATVLQGLTLGDGCRRRRRRGRDQGRDPAASPCVGVPARPVRTPGPTMTLSRLESVDGAADATLRDVLAVIDRSGLAVALLVEGDGRLAGAADRRRRPAGAARAAPTSPTARCHTRPVPRRP